MGAVFVATVTSVTATVGEPVLGACVSRRPRRKKVFLRKTCGTLCLMDQYEPQTHPADDEPDTLPYTIEDQRRYVDPHRMDFIEEEGTWPGVGTVTMPIVKPRRLLVAADVSLTEAERGLRDAAYVMKAYGVTSAATSVSAALAHLESAKRKLAG